MDLFLNKQTMANEFKTIMHIKGITKDKGYPEFQYKVIHYLKGKVNDINPTGKYDPKPGDKIYFMPGCTVPRFKMKQFCEAYKVALVKYKDKANAVFAGPSSLEAMFKEGCISMYHGASKKIFQTFVTRVLGDSDPRYAKFLEDLNSTEEDCVLMTYQVYSDLKYKNFFSIPLYKDNAEESSERYSTYDYTDKLVWEEKNVNLLKSMSASGNIYSQDDLLRLLNTGGIMDLEMYESIKRLFDSSDVSNTKLAMEAMANCDFEKSCVYLLLLIKQYGSKMRNSGNIHHVNFKSMLSFFDIEDASSVDLDDIVNCLRSKKLLSPTNLRILMPLAMEQMSKDSNLDHFKVVAVDVSDGVKQALKENILEPPTSEVVEEPTEVITPQFVPEN